MSINSVESDQIKNLEEFQEKIKLLNFDTEEISALRFEEFNKFLNQFGNLETLNQDKGVLLLLNDFYQLIKDESSLNSKSELFSDLTMELTAHLVKKPTIKLSTIELEKRKKRIKKVKLEIIKLGKKVKHYEAKELELDDLEEENNALVKIERLTKKIIKLYKELRLLENKHSYFGNEELTFDDLTDNQQLNKLLSKEILSKFKLKDDLPDYVEVSEIVDKFNNENNVLMDSKIIFKKIGAKLKQTRSQQINFVLNSYQGDPTKRNDSQIEEDEELKAKLDSQNHFKDDLDEVVDRFMKKAEQLKDVVVEDQDETEDTESDSFCEDSIDSISEENDEFIATENDRLEEFSDDDLEEDSNDLDENESKEESKDDNVADELSEDNIADELREVNVAGELREDNVADELIEIDFQDSSRDTDSKDDKTVKRKLDEEAECSKKSRTDEDCIVLD